MDELLTFKEAMELLKIGEKTLLKLLQEEPDFPARKLGREWRFSRDALVQFVALGRARDYASREGNEGHE